MGLALVAVVALMSSVAAQAQPPPVAEATATFDYTPNMHPLGFSERVWPNAPGQFVGANSDLAFWGKHVIQGQYDGFRILDASSPARPRLITDFRDCGVEGTGVGDQGDIVVFDNILVRSWNSARATDNFCGGILTPAGQEGVHIFDISDPANPVGLAFVPLPCGSHTDTGIPDPANNRLILYSNPSGGACPQIDIVEVPLDAPQNATYLGPLASGRPCHDTGVILGDVMRVACAGGNGVTVWTIDPDDGASLTSPVQLYSRSLGVGIGHSASWTWDGEILIFGHEPGGGGQAQCQATSSELNRTLFFLDGDTGDTVGTLIHPRPQTATENCTWHNYNVVPTDKRYVLVSGNYQSGISVVDFTNPANAREIAFADPAPLDDEALILGGDWSSYWYNGHIYESDITRGLIIWDLSDPAVAGARKLPFLNPQTQTMSFPFKGTAFGGN
jgi:hypothetical protein